MVVTKHNYYAILNSIPHNIIKPVHNNIKFNQHIQLSLWGMESTSHVRMGLFYETLTSGLFGGKLVDSVIRCPSDGGPYENCKPDVINGLVAWESKAVRQGRQLNLLDQQMERYRMLQILYPKYTIYFSIWRHGFQHVMNNKKKLAQLVTELSEKTYAGLVIPFSVAWTLYKGTKLKRYEWESDNRPWPNCTRWGSKDLNQFIFTPEAQLLEHGMDPHEFEITRYVLPEDMTVDGCPITPFPLVHIKHKRYRQWADDEIINKVPF